MYWMTTYVMWSNLKENVISHFRCMWKYIKHIWCLKDQLALRRSFKGDGSCSPYPNLQDKIPCGQVVWFNSDPILGMIWKGFNKSQGQSSHTHTYTYAPHLSMIESLQTQICLQHKPCLQNGHLSSKEEFVSHTHTHTHTHMI